MKELLKKMLVKREYDRLFGFIAAMKSALFSKDTAKKAAALAIAAEMLFALVFDRPVTPRGQTLDMSKFILTFSDEFDGAELDMSKWCGHCFNAEGSAFLRRGGYWVKDMAIVSDGTLKIRTEYSETGYRCGSAGYYSCAMQTTHLQKYGYFECRCILPNGEGIWAAFWMFCGGVGKVGNGGTDGAELDIFESPYYGKKNENQVEMNIHYDGYGDAHMHERVGNFFANNPYEEFNTYGMEWNENGYIFYINGVEAGRTDVGGVSMVEEYMILSVEVGDNGTIGVPSATVVNSVSNKETLPADFVVDYVRAYQYKLISA